MGNQSIGLWYGKPIEELEKDELYEVIKFLISENQKLERDKDWYFNSIIDAFKK